MEKDYFLLLFKGLFIVVAVITAIIGFRSWYNGMRIMQFGLKTTAKVIQNVQHPDTKRKGNLYTPELEVTYFDGSQKRIVMDLYLNPPEFVPNQIIHVWYMEDDKEKLCIQGKGSWLITLVLLSMSLIAGSIVIFGFK